MNFLQLAQRLRQEGGGLGSGPASVVDQTGDMRRIVDYASESYRTIQKAKRGWRWLWATVDIPVTAGQREYTQEQIAMLVPGFTRFSHWKPGVYKYAVTSEGLAGQRPLNDILYERAVRADFGTTPQANRPAWVAVTPGGGLRLSHEPTEDGTLSAVYYRTAQTLTADDDEPEMPEDFHMLIVWNALLHFGIVEAATETYARAEREAARMFKELMIDQLEPIENHAYTLVE